MRPPEGLLCVSCLRRVEEVEGEPELLVGGLYARCRECADRIAARDAAHRRRLDLAATFQPQRSRPSGGRPGRVRPLEPDDERAAEERLGAWKNGDLDD